MPTHPPGGLCSSCKRRGCKARGLAEAYHIIYHDISPAARRRWEHDITEAQDECTSIAQALRAPS